MCDYSLHAVASRPAKVGETLITTTFARTPTRGFAAESEPGMAVCLLPGTELAFERDVKYDQGWIWTSNNQLPRCQVWCGRTKRAASPSRRDRISRWKQCPGDAARRRPASDCAAIASCPSDIGRTTKAEEHGSTPAAAASAAVELARCPRTIVEGRSSNGHRFQADDRTAESAGDRA